MLFLINIKAEKKYNGGVAAINLLHEDYVKINPSQEKSYIVLKIKYGIGESKTKKDRKILVKCIDVYALEELDFSKGHKQDNRSWSKKKNPNSGRLQISKKFRKDNLAQGTKYFLSKHRWIY